MSEPTYNAAEWAAYLAGQRAAEQDGTWLVCFGVFIFGVLAGAAGVIVFSMLN